MRRSNVKPLNIGDFKGAQKALMAKGNPADLCASCKDRRDEHLPKPTFSYAKSGGSSGGSRELPVLAPTSCDASHYLCSCVAFREVDDAPVPGVWAGAFLHGEPHEAAGVKLDAIEAKAQKKKTRGRVVLVSPEPEILTIFRD